MHACISLVILFWTFFRQMYTETQTDLSSLFLNTSLHTVMTNKGSTEIHPTPNKMKVMKNNCGSVVSMTLPVKCQYIMSTLFHSPHADISTKAVEQTGS